MKKLPPAAELKQSASKQVADLIAPNLKLLFCGINPGLYSAYSGYHFARPGNRFWRVLFMAGFTNRLLHPSEQKQILAYGYGITNLVNRPSASAAELSVAEYVEGGKQLTKKLREYAPQWVAFVGVEAYRKAFSRPKATVGRQEEKISGVNVWVLPSPSGLNAHYSVADLATLFKELKNNIVSSSQ
jgi:TDG/mug DNA glycosylase family protein